MTKQMKPDNFDYKNRSTMNYKSEAIRAARELHYPQVVIERIKECDDESIIAQIMKGERERRYD